MKNYLMVCIVIFGTTTGWGQREEPIAYGDFEQWTLRYIKESGVIGGREKLLYAVGRDTVIRRNVAHQSGDSPWSCSNALAVVAGVTKASNTTYREVREDGGLCAVLRSEFDSCRVLGLVNIKVMIAGTLFLGSTLEPIRGVSDPYGKLDLGVKFEGKPSALVLDYCARLSTHGRVTKATGFVNDEWEGVDAARVYVLLQNRMETSDGRIVAKRVATGYKKMVESTVGWVNNYRLELIYGDATKSESYIDEMKLSSHLKAKNSRGRVVPIEEEGWAGHEDGATHAIVWISSGSHEAFVGSLGNELWVDNIRWMYE